MVELFQAPTQALLYIGITAILVQICMKQKRYRFLAAVLMSMLFLMSWQTLADEMVLKTVLAGIAAVTFVSLTELIPSVSYQSRAKKKTGAVDYTSEANQEGVAEDINACNEESVTSEKEAAVSLQKRLREIRAQAASQDLDSELLEKIPA